MSHQVRQSRGTQAVAALDRSLTLLEAVLADRSGLSLAALATGLGLPRSSAHRQVTTLLRAGWLERLDNGRMVAGPRLAGLTAAAGPAQRLTAAAGPALRRLAVRFGCVAQLGTLEGDMVTYRCKAGLQAGAFFTRIDQQLEAYCTGLGKVLLAQLPEAAREAYLAGGPFPALTANTITDPAALRIELLWVRARGYAIDAGEIAEGLFCISVPVYDRGGEVAAAISISITGTLPTGRRLTIMLGALQTSAEAIGTILPAKGPWYCA